MIDTILDVAARIDAFLWGPWTLVFIGSVSLFFTIRTKVFQVRGLGEIFRLIGRNFLRCLEQCPPFPELDAINHFLRVIHIHIRHIEEWLESQANCSQGDHRIR